MSKVFTCKGEKGMRPISWKGEINSFRTNGSSHELTVYARDSYFQILIGKYADGEYICIPNWGIGTTIAGMGNREWNLHQLSLTYPAISLVDLISIVDAVVAYNKYLLSIRSKLEVLAND